MKLDSFAVGILLDFQIARNERVWDCSCNGRDLKLDGEK